MAEKPIFVGTEDSPNGTYEVYKGSDAESAREFLQGKQVEKPHYYVIVETPVGNWGIDIKGLYLENLLPWQTDIESADCNGITSTIPNMFGLEMAARGINDNFVTKVQCGKCEKEWEDGLRYKNVTLVKCPACKAMNKIDTSNFNVVGV